jgi:Glycosyl hydrolase family 26
LQGRSRPWRLQEIDVWLRGNTNLAASVIRVPIGGSAALLSAALAFLVFACPAPAAPNWPNSYDSGPAGRRIILPPTKGVLVGLAAPPRQIRKRQHFIGRRLDIEHQFWGACSFPTSAVQAIASRRHIPMISWVPAGPQTFSLDQIDNGEADECFRSFGAGLAAWDHRLFLRIYWEFNGDWMPWAGTGSLFISAWRRTVTVLRSVGVRKASFVWAPNSGPCCFESYPGDRYVDWVAADAYNWNSPDAWCWPATHPGWCQFREIFGGTSDNVEHVLGPRKPFMVAETGSREGSPGRKGRWFRRARDAIKARFPHMHALVYMDYDFSGNGECCNWRLDSSRSSLRGFRALARDRHFWTRR